MLKITKHKVTVLGAGNMGTALAQVIAKNGFKVKIWNYEGDLLPLEQINRFRQNKKYLPKIKLSNLIQVEADLSSALNKADIVFFVIPSICLSDIIKRVSKLLPKNTICVDATKGLVNGKLAFHVFGDLLPNHDKNKLVSISGPSIAKQMALGDFTVLNIAGYNSSAIKKAKSVLENKYLKLVVNNDLIGLELAGSLKNVYAILFGICDGLRQSNNTKSVILSLSLHEMGQVIRNNKGKEETVYDFCGLGDLLTTSLSKNSRNRQFGEYLGQGYSAVQSLKKVKQTVEGYEAVGNILILAKKSRTNVPLVNIVQKIIDSKLKPRDGIQKILDSI